jgi:hypothetical protein
MTSAAVAKVARRARKAPSRMSPTVSGWSGSSCPGPGPADPVGGPPPGARWAEARLVGGREDGVGGPEVRSAWRAGGSPGCRPSGVASREVAPTGAATVAAATDADHRTTRGLLGRGAAARSIIGPGHGVNDGRAATGRTGTVPSATLPYRGTRVDLGRDATRGGAPCAIRRRVSPANPVLPRGSPDRRPAGLVRLVGRARTLGPARAVAAVPLLLPAGGNFEVIAPLFAFLAAYVLLTALVPRDHRVRAADLVVSALLIAAQRGAGRPVPAVPHRHRRRAGVRGRRDGRPRGRRDPLDRAARPRWPGPASSPSRVSAAPPRGPAAPARGGDDRLRGRCSRTASCEGPAGAAGGQPAAVLAAGHRGRHPGWARHLDGVGRHPRRAPDDRGVRARDRVRRGARSAPARRDLRLRPGEVPSLRLDELRIGGAAASPRFVTPRELPPRCRPRRSTRTGPWSASVRGHLAGVLLLGFDEPTDGRTPSRSARRRSRRTVRWRSRTPGCSTAPGPGRRCRPPPDRRGPARRRRPVARPPAHGARAARPSTPMPRMPMRTGAARTRRRLGALEDLRATIGGCVARSTGGLPALIARHLDEVRSPTGPRLSFEARPRWTSTRSEPRTSSASCRRRSPTRSATLEPPSSPSPWRRRPGARPPGRGRRHRPARADGPAGHRGGLRSMRERAERLGGELDVRGCRATGRPCSYGVPVETPRTEADRSDHRSDHLRPGDDRDVPRRRRR